MCELGDQLPPRASPNPPCAATAAPRAPLGSSDAVKRDAGHSSETYTEKQPLHLQLATPLTSPLLKRGGGAST